MQRFGSELNHISVVIRSLCVKMGYLDEQPETLDDEGNRVIDPDTQTLWEYGSAFEEALRCGLRIRRTKDNPHRYIENVELELDQLRGNTDLLDTVLSGVVEIKFTHLSTNNDVEGLKFWKYWVQGMAYAHMINWNRVILCVGHIRGDYKPGPPRPKYREWMIEPTADELRQNWLMIRSEHQRMQTAASRRLIAVA